MSGRSSVSALAHWPEYLIEGFCLGLYNTGLFAGALVMTYISIEAPLSGMSMNLARTLASRPLRQAS